jgi:hypothetical protein
VARATRTSLELPAAGAPTLAWFVREAWPSPATGTSLAEGLVIAGNVLAFEAETDGLVVFGDGMERDHLSLAWGQRVTVRVAEQSLRLVAG